ncbi:MAG: L,D-transpeptidase, partial [Armatimonadota bacterium]|nr:L,D-transpeptidase [Armatimonadota bacterium]
EKELYLRANAEGAEAVRLAAATDLEWKPGEPLPERPTLPPVAPPQAGLLSGILSLSVPRGEAVEAQGFEITWEADPRVAWVALSARVERTPKGGVARGSYTQPIARVPASQGRHVWQVPWLDNIRFVLRADALDGTRQVIGRAELPLAFRPAELAGEEADGIYIHLSRVSRQRLYVQEGGQLTMVFLCSGASTGQILPGHQHPDDPHDHYGTFRIQAKDPDHVSNLDPTWRMPYAMRYLAGHWIHVTARNQYYRLGRPASHGCVRLHMVDGRRLFQRTRIGELVKIY